MRLVVIDKNNNVIVELPAEEFRRLLIKYVEVCKDVGKAFDEIAKELKKKTMVV